MNLPKTFFFCTVLGSVLCVATSTFAQPSQAQKLVKFKSLSVQKSKTGCTDKTGNPIPGLAVVIHDAFIQDDGGQKPVGTILINPVQCGEHAVAGARRATQILNHTVGNQGFGSPAINSISTDGLHLGLQSVRLENEIENEAGSAKTATIRGVFTNKGEVVNSFSFSFGVKNESLADVYPILASVEHPADGFSPMDPMSWQVRVHSNGAVVKVTKKYIRPGKLVSVSTIEVGEAKSKIPEILACINEIEKTKPQLEQSQCMDDPGTHYKGKLGEKDFAVRKCGELKVVDVPCARGLVDILYQIDTQASSEQ